MLRGVSLLRGSRSGGKGPSWLGKGVGRDLGEERTEGILLVPDLVWSCGRGGSCGRCCFPAPNAEGSLHGLGGHGRQAARPQPLSGTLRGLLPLVLRNGGNPHVYVTPPRDGAMAFVCFPCVRAKPNLVLRRGSEISCGESSNSQGEVSTYSVGSCILCHQRCVGGRRRRSGAGAFFGL